MQLSIEKQTDFLGTVDYTVWITSEYPKSIIKCVGIYNTLEEAEKKFEEIKLKVREPKKEVIKSIEI